MNLWHLHGKAYALVGSSSAVPHLPTKIQGWLEAVRSRREQDITGIPPDEYSEVSLLEPHKRFQNSITLLQKRKDSETGAQYEEPLYSKFA